MGVQIVQSFHIQYSSTADWNRKPKWNVKFLNLERRVMLRMYQDTGHFLRSSNQLRLRYTQYTATSVNVFNYVLSADTLYSGNVRICFRATQEYPVSRWRLPSSYTSGTHCIVMSVQSVQCFYRSRSPWLLRLPLLVWPPYTTRDTGGNIRILVPDHFGPIHFGLKLHDHDGLVKDWSRH